MFEKIRWRGLQSSVSSARSITQAHNNTNPRNGKAFFRQLRHEENDNKGENPGRDHLHPSQTTHGKTQAKLISTSQHSKDASEPSLGAPGKNAGPRRLDVLA